MSTSTSTSTSTSSYAVNLTKPPGHLTTRDLAVLTIERSWWKYAGRKDTVIRDRFGCSSTRYYQVLNELIDRPAAMAHDPLTVKRLSRLRDERQRQRSARRLG